jgi:hypothetical protein
MKDPDSIMAPYRSAICRRGASIFYGLLLAGVLSACTTVIARNPVPEAAIDAAAPYGIRVDGLMRIWGDELPDDQSNSILKHWTRVLRVTRADEIAAGGPIREVALLISGGGSDGAFGAGLLTRIIHQGQVF